MMTLRIAVSADLLTKGSIYAALYGKLSSTGNWVCLSAGGVYEAASSPVPAFQVFKPTDLFTVNLPEGAIESAHIVFGVGALPSLPVVGGVPQQPDPIIETVTYDFVEFTHDGTDTLFANTTMIDQFGLPIRIQIQPACLPLPNGAGVTTSLVDTYHAYVAYVSAPGPDFLQCSRNAFRTPVAAGPRRIVSPKYAIEGYCIRGLEVALSPSTGSTLTGNLYYAVTAVDGNGNETYAQSYVVQIEAEARQGVRITWAAAGAQPPGTAQYFVYRGKVSGESFDWEGRIAAVPAGGPAVGGVFFDDGSAVADASHKPVANPLTTLFDGEIQSFFTRYEDTRYPLVLNVFFGFLYTFNGTTGTDPGGNRCLNLVLVSVANADGTVNASPPILLGTTCRIYYPYWNTNTYDGSLPGPPVWTVFKTVTASEMVLAAEGVFADNAVQVRSNAPAGLSADGLAIYGTLLGSLENQVVSAFTRGIANSSTIAPMNWGNDTAPVQTEAELVAGSSSLIVGTTYFYVITALNAAGETVGSLEFGATPTAESPCVQVNWMPKTGPSSFNIYRGTVSQKQDTLAGSVANDGAEHSFVDDGGGTRGSATPPVYFPAGTASSAYDAFFHQPAISINGAAYAGPYDDQGGQSSTISVKSPTELSVVVGPWGASS